MENNEFSSAFAQRFVTYLNTIYLPDTTIAKVEALKAAFHATNAQTYSQMENPCKHGCVAGKC
jgi:spore coat protein CotH